MKKGCSTAYLKSLLFIIAFISSHALRAQITVATPVPSGVVYVSDTDPGVVVFGVRNTNSSAITITGLGSYLEPGGAGSYTLWYHPTAVTGAPTAITAANGWIQLAPSATVTPTSNAVIPILSGLTLTIPANTTYRLALQGPIHGPYYGTAGSTSDLFSGSGLLIYAQANAASPTYAGTFPNSPASFTPRSFYGTLTFVPASACTDPPTPGTATSTASAICNGQNFTLDLTGHSIGTGQTYQWQYSTDNTNWTNLGSAQNSPTFVTSQPGARYYRAVVTCGAGSANSVSVQVQSSGDAVSGTFTINSTLPAGSGNFTSFTAAINSLLACGINGPVVFNVGGGPYNEQIIIPAITGSSATNTVTFNGNNATIQFGPSVSDSRYIIRLDGADYIRFNNLNVVATSGATYGWGFQLSNGANNNIINNCTINMSNVTSTTQSNSGGIVGSSTNTSVTADGNASNNAITNNTITGGYQGIIINGAATALNAANNTITGNTVQDFYATGIELTDNNGSVVANNNIHRTTRAAVTTFAGVELGTGNQNVTVNANRIHDTHTAATTQTGTAYGIFSNACDAPAGSENKVTNNLIYKFNSGSGTIYGLYNSGSDGVFYYHNTIVLDNAGSTAGITRGFYQTTAATNIQFKNNIVYITRGGTGAKNCIYLGTTGSAVTANKNVYYLNSAAGTNGIGFYSTNFVTLTDWQTANSNAYDQQSLSTNPLFVDPPTANYAPAALVINNIGDNVGVAADILGNPRTVASPDPGAYEISGAPCISPPTPGTAIVSETPVCTGVNFTLSLTGNSFGDGQTYQWQSSPTIGGTYNNIGSSSTSSSFVTSATVTAFYRAAVTCGGNTQYSTPVEVVVTPALAAGTYTINGALPASATNFQSFGAAVAALSCGIAGPVVFNVATATYNEQVIIPNVPGTSAVNTITFNGNGATLSFASANTDERATLKLNGADYVTVDSLIVNASAGTYGFGVHLMNNSDFNTIRKCTINSATNSTSTNFTGVVISPIGSSATTSGASDCDNNTFDRNTVNGGYYGMTMVGGSAALIQNNKFTNNIVKDFYLYGIYVTYTDNALVEKNTISRATRSASLSTFYGIYFTTGSQAGTVSKNRISSPFNMDPANTNTFYGIYFTGCDAPSAALANKVNNNLIYNITGSGSVYAFYNSSSDNVIYYHNTISLDGPAAGTISTDVTRGFYQTTSATGIIFRNNLISLTRGGASEKNCIYLATTASTITSNNNNFFIAPGVTTANTGTYGTTPFASLANWQTGSGKDANSAAIDPQFLDINSGYYYPNNGALNNLGAAVGITTDIMDLPRSATTPDIGAYEFVPVFCTEPPVPGTVTTTASPVCQNISFTLGVSGGSLGAGMSYKWQFSNNNVDWNDIPGATATTYTTSQTQSTYYRIVYTCGATSVPSAGLQIVTPAGASGVYTINSAGGGDFLNFNAAYNFIKCGISGPVTFNVAPGTGPYNEQLIMEAVPGASAVNTVTFNGNGNALSYLSNNSGERATIKLNGADFITFDSLTINANGTTDSEYGWAVQLLNSADSNTFRRCTINVNTTNTTTQYAGIVVNNSATSATTGSSQSDGNIFDRNTVTGGYYGMIIIGTSALFNNYNKVTRNTFKDFYFYGLYANGSNELTLDSNTFTRPVRTTVSDCNAIYFTGLSANARITRNRIHNPFGGAPASTSAFTGIMITASDALVARENIVSNNLIYNLTGNGNVIGINNSGSDNAWYFHNTIVIDGAAAASTATNTSRGFYQTTDAFGLQFKNNIIVVSRGGLSVKHAIYLNSPATDIISNRNDFFITSTTGSNFIGFASANDRPILADWQVTGQDANSVSINPLFVDPANGDYTPFNAGMDNLGQPAPTVTVDILGKPRSATTPDLGAYEFAPPACTVPPIGGAAQVSSTPVCENSFVMLSVTGNSTGTGQTYVWQASGDIAGPYVNISGVMTSASFNITATANQYYRVAITCSGNTAYSTPVLLNVTPGLPGGIYTINPTQPPSATNFISFNAAKDAMACGITGPVVFNVEPATGPYLEQLILDSIPGTSNDNTITFNGNGNTIQFSSSNTNERAVIKLNGTDHVTFDSLTIDATGTGTHGFGVHLMNNADSNTIRRCNIITVANSTSTNYAGVAMSASATSATTTGATQCDYNLITNNTITGGYYGITLVGSVALPLQSNRVINNTIRDFYIYGVYIGANNRLTVENNNISRPTRTASTTTYGIYMTGVSTRLNITRNRIHNPFGSHASSTSEFNGIYMTGVDGVQNQENIVSNNLVYNINGLGAIYGIYNAGSSYARYLHNTISLDNSANSGTAITRGFYQTTEADEVYFRNNIVTITRAGTGVKHGLYFNTATSVIYSDKNDIYVNGPAGTNTFGAFTHPSPGGLTQYATLAAWQTGTSLDAASVSINPQYTDPSSGNFSPLVGALDNIGMPVNIAIDILGLPRSSTTPDIGAYEFSIAPCTSPPVPGTATATPSSGVCLGEQVTLDLTGNSTGGFQTYRWQRAPNTGGPWTDISGDLFVAKFVHTLSSADQYFRCVVTCAGNSQNSTTVQVILNPLLLAGDYTIDPAAPSSATNFQSFAAAVAALECGITGSVRFNAVPGTYNEQVLIKPVPGASATSTVTFRSQNGNPASVILSYNAATADNNYVVKLDSASHIIYRSMTISALNATNGRAVELAGTAANDSIVNCIINVPVSTNTNTNVVGVYALGLVGSNNVIKGNTVNNGNTGIYMSGMSTQSNSNIIDSNTVNGSYYYGIYAANINDAKVNKNTVNRSGLLNTSAYGIYVTNCDSLYEVRSNNVNISNTGVIVYGIYLTGGQSTATAKGLIAGNKVTAGTANTGNQYGIYMTTMTLATVMNNVVLINTSGATSYGLYSTTTGGVNFFNNTVRSSATSATNNVAAYFGQTSATNGEANVNNNIFYHASGGRALEIVNPSVVASDYNMLYTTGAELVRKGAGTTANPYGNYATLQQWRDAFYWDFNSIVYLPALTSATDLTPNLASPDVWAIHGRGVQIPGNSFDFNNNVRPTTLTAGVPDLGAYEFVPTSIPVNLTAIPATPAPNTTQTFMLGTDTVTKITWGATVPATVTAKRYSGAVPPGLSADYMYFYTDFDFTGTAPTGHTVRQFYLDPWRGFIANEAGLKLARTNTSNVWQTAATSIVNTMDNTLLEAGVTVLDKFTGLSDGIVPPPPPVVVNPSETSNAGTKFWVAYGHQYYFDTDNSQNMVLYLGTSTTAASVTVRVNGTSWVRSYSIPANTVISTEFMPKYGAFDARMLQEGLSEKGISIESNVPITAFAHIYSSASSGATMLMPVGTYGYEYYALTSKQAYTGSSYSWVYVVAPYDSTVVEITPAAPTLGGRPAGVPFTVTLKKGQVYQVLGQKTATNTGYDMTGTKVRSIANSNNKCYPIAVFSGSSRTAIACDDALPTLNGDNIMQQNFPYRAWGKRYLTAPTSASTAATTLQTNIYKIAVKDPTTEVRVNGVLQTNLINNLYYQVVSNEAKYIEANKPVMVAQFIGSTSECGGTGVYDPEMIYISPIEQGIKNVGLYRNVEDGITVQYLTLIVPSGGTGLSSLRIDGSNVFDHTYDHYLPGYKVVVKRWAATSGQARVVCDSAFTAITYGLGSVESYGYNAGTLVLNLNVLPSISNVFNPSGSTNDYTCQGTPFTVSFLSAVQPNTIEWNFSQVPNITPNTNVVQNNPTPAGTVVINGVTYYRYTLSQQYVINTPGNYSVPIAIIHPEVEGCNNRMESSIPITVIGTPTADFPTNMAICPGVPAQFNGQATTVNSVPIATWSWNFGDLGTATGQNPTHTYAAVGNYNVQLNVVAAEGCIATVTKPVTVGNGPAVNIVPDSVGACLGDNVTFNVQNPVAGAIYSWYTTPTGGTASGTGTSFTINNVTGPVSYYVESVLNGCPSPTRKRVQVTVRPSLTAPVAIVDSLGTNLIRFRWGAVTGAIGYEVTTNGGTSWAAPSSGPTGLTHTVSGLAIGQTVTFQVRALGGCQPSASAAITATTVTDQVYIPNTFTPNGDGRNDQLKVYSNIIRDIRAMVFNQWGEKIVEVRNPVRDADGGYRIWDGRHKGKEQPSGVYIYVCEITLNDGKKIQRTGSINLAR